MFNKEIKISKKTVDENRCFIIAEISGNHNGNFNIMKKLILNLKKLELMQLKYKHTQLIQLQLIHPLRIF